MVNKLCMNCFSSFRPDEDGSRCPVCGWDNAKSQPQGLLKYQTELASRYVIGRARYANGEGITYSALDKTAQKLVDIREFFPRAIARREGDSSIAAVREHSRTFQQYMENFLELSKSVSRLREVTVVESVLDIFEENSTIYTVYKAVNGVPLRRYVEENGGHLSWNETSRLFTPAITALSLINSLGVCHLAISPESLRVTPDGNLLITGFHINAIHRAGGLLDLDLYPGCAAVEQYSAKAVCGEVSDVYALGACMLFALTGELPAEASQRLQDQRLMISKDILKAVPPFAVTAIANSLQIKQALRTGSFETFRTELTAAPALADEVEETDAIRRLPPVSRDLPRRRYTPPPFVWLIASCAIALVVLGIFASRWLGRQGMSFSDLGQIFEESSEEEPVEVPDMRNQNYQHWEKRTQSGELDFKLKISSRVFDANAAEGIIISQVPEPGETVQPGGTVSVTVSNGSATRTLPDYTGSSFADFQAVLTENGFVPLKEEQRSSDVEQGFVIGYKDHEVGDTLDYGSTVTVLVSAGAEE